MEYNSVEMQLFGRCLLAMGGMFLNLHYPPARMDDIIDHDGARSSGGRRSL
jgi:hypothetical protein